MTEQVKTQLNKFADSLTRLKDVLKREIDEDDIILDAAIQRFEFTFENAWKAVKLILKYNGEDCISPRECIKRAFRHGWIENEELFLELLECRNLTTHTYAHDMAMEVYSSVKANAFLFDDLLIKLEESVS